MPQAPAPPADRYGPPARRPAPGLVAGVVVVVTAFLGWVVWAALGASGPGLRGEVTAFRVRSDRAVEVRVAAAPGTSGRLVCSVRALDRTRDVVGVAGVGLDTDRARSREKWVTVRTRARAVTATVGTCSPG